MQKTDLITHIHSAIHAFDKRTSQGLYAISEFQPRMHEHPQNLDWQLILRQTVEQLGYQAPKKFTAASMKEGRFYCFGNEKLLNIELVRFSKIKVRLYGDTFRLDPHLDFAKRWDNLRLARRIRSHVRPFQDDERILILIAFGKGSSAFDHELSELEEELGAATQSAIYTSEQWPDPHGRGFETLCASWYWPGH